MKILKIFRNFYATPIWVHVFWSIVLTLGLVTIVYFSLYLFTYQNRFRITPNLIGMNTEIARQLLEDRNLKMVIRDSMFLTNYPKGVIVKQMPEPDAEVKIYRKVYLIVNKKVPPKVDIPEVVGLNLQVATGVITGAGFRISDTLYRSDLAKDLVLELRYKGKVLKEQDKLPMGESLSLVVGTGGGNNIPSMAQIPDLLGKTLSEARILVAKEDLDLVVTNALDFRAYNSDELYIIYQQPQALDGNKLPHKVPARSHIEVRISEIDPN